MIALRDGANVVTRGLRTDDDHEAVGGHARSHSTSGWGFVRRRTDLFYQRSA